MQIRQQLQARTPVRGGMGGPNWYPLVVSGGNPICSFRQFLAKTYRFASIQNVTDRRQTDRQTTSCSKGATDSTVGQKPGQTPGLTHWPVTWPDPAKIADPVTRWPVTRRPGSICGSWTSLTKINKTAVLSQAKAHDAAINLNKQLIVSS